MTTFLSKHHGNKCLQMSEVDMREANKLFKFIDYDQKGFITKDRLLSFIQYLKKEHCDNELFMEHNIIYIKLSNLYDMPWIKLKMRDFTNCLVGRIAGRQDHAVTFTQDDYKRSRG